MNTSTVVVDANIAFKLLCAGSSGLRQRMDPNLPLQFYSPRFLFVELFKHKERLARVARFSEEELLAGLHTLVSRLQFINEANIPLGTWMEAYRLCKEVDEKDTPYVALTLHLDGLLWTDDDLLKAALRNKGFDRFV